MRSSASTARVVITSAPTISGTVRVGYTLYAKPNTWTSGTTFSYQWYAGTTAIKGATRSSIRLTSGLRGKQVWVKVTGKRSGFATVARSSVKTAKVR